MNNIKLNRLFQKKNGINIVNFNSLTDSIKINIKDSQKRFYNVLDKYKALQKYADKGVLIEGLNWSSPTIKLNSKVSTSDWLEEFSIKLDVNSPKNTNFMLLSVTDNNIPKRFIISYDFFQFDDFFDKLKDFRKGNTNFINNTCPKCGKKIRSNAQNFRATVNKGKYQLYHLNCGVSFKQNDLFVRNTVKQLSLIESMIVEASLSNDETASNNLINERFIKGTLFTLIHILKNTSLLKKLSEVSGISVEQLVKFEFQIRNELKESHDSKLLRYLGYAFEKRYLTLSGYGKSTTDNISLDEPKVREKYFSENMNLKDGFNIIANILSDSKEVKVINQFINDKLIQQNSSHSGKELKNIQIIKEKNVNAYVEDGEEFWFTPKVYDTVQGKWFEVGDLSLSKKFHYDEEPKLTKEEEQSIISNVKKYEKAILLQNQAKEHMPHNQVQSLKYYAQQVTPD